MDNLEVPLSASVHEDPLRILFERHLVLDVWDPAAWRVEDCVLHATDHDGHEVRGARLSRPAVLIV